MKIMSIFRILLLYDSVPLSLIIVVFIFLAFYHSNLLFHYNLHMWSSVVIFNLLQHVTSCSY